MKTLTTLFGALALAILTAVPTDALAQRAGAGAARPERPRVQNGLLAQGRRALDGARWMDAAELFARAAALEGPRRDAALYWRAYAQNRLGQRAEALQTLAELQMLFPSGRFAGQARALEIEIRRDLGEVLEPTAADDEQLRLIALQALQRSDPERALPMLENVLRGTAGPRLKARALFLVAQSERPEARQLLVDVASGEASPELRRRAVGYLAARGDAETLVALARTERDPALRREMVQRLARMRDKVALDYLAELAR